MKQPLSSKLTCLIAAACLLAPAPGRTMERFNALTYSPPVVPIEVDAEKCRVQYFVAVGGHDTAAGTSPEQAFATLARARDAVRELKRRGPLPAGGVAVNLRDGVFSLAQSLELTAADSGTETAPVIYRGWRGETPRIIGGRKLAASDFTKVTDEKLLARMDPAARGRVVSLDAAKLGLTHAGPFPEVFSDHGGLLELFYNGKRMSLSRWPTKGYTTMRETVINGDKNIPGAFLYRDERPTRWDASRGVWLKGQWRVPWEDPAIKVARIDVEKKQITFAAGIQLGIGDKYTRPKGNGKEPWCAINLLEEITQPGQWCLDFTTRTLYFWPPSPLDAGADILVSQLEKPLIAATGLAHTAFIGLTFENTLGDAFSIREGTRNLIAGCTIRNLAGNGIVLHGMGNGIQSCDLYGLGRGCVILSGGDRRALTPSGNYVVNNHLHHYGVLKAQYSAAVDLYHENNAPSAVGILVAHNLIHHAPRDAVLFAGNDNVFELNEIHRCAYDSRDVGAFYSWLDWTIRGVVIRHNYVHDTVGGVNPDDGASGTIVLGNIFEGERIGVWIASGPDHTVTNNIFIKPTGPVFGLDDRGVSRQYATNKRLLDRVAEINPTQPPWSERYPEMATLMGSHPELPLRTKFTGNVVFIGSGPVEKNGMSAANKNNGELLTMTGNFVTATDPGFVNFAAKNLTLKPGAPVFQQLPDFPPIPFGKIGLQIDLYRKRLPTNEEAGRTPDQDPWAAQEKDAHFAT